MFCHICKWQFHHTYDSNDDSNDDSNGDSNDDSNDEVSCDAARLDDIDDYYSDFHDNDGDDDIDISDDTIRNSGNIWGVISCCQNHIHRTKIKQGTVTSG